jgi:hypothetical protein
VEYCAGASDPPIFGIGCSEMEPVRSQAKRYSPVVTELWPSIYDPMSECLAHHTLRACLFHRVETLDRHGLECPMRRAAAVARGDFRRGVRRDAIVVFIAVAVDVRAILECIGDPSPPIGLSPESPASRP